VPIILNITFYNNQTVSSAVAHTFTIDDNQGNHEIDTGLVNPQTNASLRFTINSMTNITFSNTTVTNRSFTPGPPPLGTDNGTIQWYCIPHVGLGMKGTIALAGVKTTAGPEENGVFLRAYWIGIIGIAAMLVWIGISYYIIKGSSPRFKDNRGHVRKGLP
jgi:plastocyanin